jgi:hypothetical protein
MILSAVLLAQYGNIKKTIYYPIQMLNTEEKRFQIIAQNETHISIVMPCSSKVLDESRNTFRIEGPYILD